MPAPPDPKRKTIVVDPAALGADAFVDVGREPSVFTIGKSQIGGPDVIGPSPKGGE